MSLVGSLGTTGGTAAGTTGGTTAAHAAGPLRIYDNAEYDEQCAYHNCVDRVRGYEHGVTTVPGLDACYDCARTVQVSGRYLLATGQDASADSIGVFINNTIQSFGTRRALKSSYAKSSNRSYKKYPKHSYI